MKIRILGCGPSTGLPTLSGSFGICDPNNPKNRRTSSSALVQTDDNLNILIDTSPDIRRQMERVNFPQIDAVFLTHVHYDHIGGFDDLRALSISQNKRIPVYLSAKDVQYVSQRYPYLTPKHIELQVVEPNVPFFIGKTKITPIWQDHGTGWLSLGFRMNNTAYCTDVLAFDKQGFENLRNLDLLILGGACRDNSKNHHHLNTALKWIADLKPKKTYLTHLGTEMDYETLRKELPKNVKPAYDNLILIVKEPKYKTLL